MTALTRTPAESPAAPTWSASTTTSSPVVNAIPVSTCTTAAGVVPAVTLSSIAPVPNSRAAAPPHQAVAAKTKVEQLWNDQSPAVSTAINADKLAFELVSHPNRSFVNNLLNALRYGSRISYTGPQKSRVSRNLILASQHPEVITASLNKEIQLGGVAGPFPSSPLLNFQCHPIGVVPKKHSTEWQTICHLSYPKGNSINDYIPKDPYSLQYVRVDNAINVIRRLGPGAFMAKTDLKSAFRLMPIHPDDWNLLGKYWKSHY